MKLLLWHRWEQLNCLVNHAVAASSTNAFLGSDYLTQCTTQQSSLEELWARAPSAQPELISSARQHHFTVLIHEFKETSVQLLLCHLVHQVTLRLPGWL